MKSYQVANSVLHKYGFIAGDWICLCEKCRYESWFTALESKICRSCALELYLKDNPNIKLKDNWTHKRYKK